MAWIGMRGPDAYDGKLLWGMEYRMLPHDTQSEAMIIMLNTLQASMATRDYGISRSQIQTWLERRFKWDWRKPWVFGEKVSDIVSSVHYNKDLETLVAEAPTELRPLYDQIREKQGKALDDHFNKMQELKMLLHDWSLDPNFMDQPELLANIRKEQIEILTTLSKRTLISDGNYIFFAQKFIRISGLYEATLKSLGLVSSVEAPK